MKKIILLSALCIFSFATQAQIAIGSDAPDIKLPDSLGKWNVLHETEAKLVLLDFWAAWCYPCVKSMPDLVALEKKYHDRGLRVYAVSLDKNYYNWVAMCQKLELPFILVNDAYGMSGKACKDYNISSIPNKLLLKNKKVIGANMSLYDLEKLIEQELGSSK